MKLVAPTVRIRCHGDVPAYEVVVALRGKEMSHWCRDYDQAVKWAQVECKSYGIAGVTVEHVYRDQTQAEETQTLG